MTATSHPAPGLFLAEQDVVETFFDRDWTDGLPVVAPTEARVSALLEQVGMAFSDPIGTVPERRKRVTVGKAAVNAVMAGCRAEYFPVVVAGLRAILDPALNIHALSSSTGGPAPLLIVSGPVAERIGMNSGGNAFGPGNRANATIGRAIRLVLMNVLGARPGLLDGACLGHPGKYTYCIAEADPPDPWPTLREELGYAKHWSVVAAIGVEGPRQVSNALNPDPEAVLRTIAAAIACPANNIVGHPSGVGGQCVVVLGPEHAETLHEGGWTKQAMREFLVEHTVLTRGDLVRAGRLLAGPEPENDPLPTLDDPSDVLIVTAGGYGGRWSAVVPTWSPTVTTRYTVSTVEQEIPDDELTCDDGSCRVHHE